MFSVILKVLLNEHKVIKLFHILLYNSFPHFFGLILLWQCILWSKQLDIMGFNFIFGSEQHKIFFQALTLSILFYLLFTSVCIFLLRHHCFFFLRLSLAQFVLKFRPFNSSDKKHLPIHLRSCINCFPFDINCSTKGMLVCVISTIFGYIFVHRLQISKAGSCFPLFYD